MNKEKIIPSADISSSPELQEAFLSRLATLIYKSFEYSQGYLAIQQLIFQYVGIVHPDWCITDTQKHTLMNTVFERVFQRFYTISHGDKNAARIRDNFAHPNKKDLMVQEKLMEATNEVINIFNAEFNEKIQDGWKRNKESVLEELFDWMLRRDVYFLVGIDGRPERKDDARNRRNEPFMSHIRYFIGEEYKDSEPVLAQMLVELKEFFRQSLLRGDYVLNRNIHLDSIGRRVVENNKPEVAARWPSRSDMFSALVVRWEEMHPGESFLAPFDLPEHTRDNHAQSFSTD